MSNSKTRVRPSSGTVISLLLVTAVALIAGQAMCVVEVGAQSEPGTSVPSTEPGVSSDAANRAIHGQRYVGLYEGDSFVGNRPVTREQLLVILDRVLRDIEGGQIVVESSDVQLLRKLVMEFQDELVALSYQLRVLEAEMQERHKRDVVLTEQTLQVREEANDLMGKLTGFAEDLRQFVLDQAASNSQELDSTAEDLSRFGEHINQILQGMEEIWQKIDELRASQRDSTVDLAGRIDGLKYEQNVLSSRFSALRTDTLNSYDDLTSRMESLEDQLASLSNAQRSAEKTVAAQEQRIKQLERQLVVVQTQYEEDLKSMNDRILTLSARLSALEGRGAGSSSGEASDLASGSPAQSSGE